ncbi:MAG: hypothetical protein AAFU77_05680 [Myxococcota bacterium]
MLRILFFTALVSCGSSDDPSCNDGVQNGAESDIDCGGGTCASCALAELCLDDLDCGSGFCSGSRCVASSCGNCALDAGEVTLDEDGLCPSPRNHCCFDSDCPGADVCIGRRCVSGSCADGRRSTGETDVDCGGRECPACLPGDFCLVAVDCVTAQCVAGLCR